MEFVGGDRCCWNNRTTPPDEPEANPVLIALHPVAEDFFDTYRTELLAGEAWTRGNATASPTPVVVSEAMAIRFFGSAAAAVGRELPDVQEGVVISGVAEGTRHYGLDQEHDYAVYLPMEALPFPITRAIFALRLSDVSANLAQQIREAVWSVEADLPVTDVATLEGWLDDSSATRRFGSLLFGAFGTVALLLAAAGLYGTLLYTVGQRRQELGIRLALGAGRGRIQNDVIRHGVVHAAVGVAAGVLLTVWVGRLLESWLYGVTGTDAVTLASSAAVLFATAVAASWVPAYRAGRTDPLETLKAE
jgi:putative ABC transport system permease protein